MLMTVAPAREPARWRLISPVCCRGCGGWSLTRAFNAARNGKRHGWPSSTWPIAGTSTISRSAWPWLPEGICPGTSECDGRDRPHRTSKLALEDEGAGGRNRQGRPDRILCRLCPAQDPASYGLTWRVARDLGLPIVEAEGATCCGHPTRGHQKPALPASPIALTACPGCESSLRAAGIATTPLWEALVAAASRRRRRLAAVAPAFVPYVGCMGDRDGALDALSEAASLAGIKDHRSYPSLHAGCCGAPGSMSVVKPLPSSGCSILHKSKVRRLSQRAYFAVTISDRRPANGVCWSRSISGPSSFK